jgi:CheY-like chemotaxis protein
MKTIPPNERRPGGFGGAVKSWFQRWPEVQTTAPKLDARIAAEPTVTPNSGLRVLVVDDNPSNLMIASEQLQQCGVSALLASDGAQAVHLACEMSLHMILMDIQMPVMDGLTATASIRRFESTYSRPRTPVVAYSSSEVARAVRTASGIDDALAKPCTAAELETCLVRWCAGFHRWPECMGARGRAPQQPGDTAPWIGASVAADT